MTITLSSTDAAKLERRVAAGEPIRKIAADFGLLDQEVAGIVDRVRASRAARTNPDTPAPAVVPVQQQGPTSTQTPAGGSAPGPVGAGASANGKRTGSEPTMPPAGFNPSDYLEHADKRISKAAAAAHKTLEILRGLVKAYEEDEAYRQRLEQERAEAAAAVERLECPARGVIPTQIRQAYAAAHDQEAAL